MLLSYVNPLSLCVFALLCLTGWFGYVAYIKVPHEIRKLQNLVDKRESNIENLRKVGIDAKKRCNIYIQVAIFTVVIYFFRLYGKS